MPDGRQCLEAVDVRHLEVKQNHIRLEQGEHLNGLRAVYGLADNIHIALQLNGRTKPVPHHGMVVDDQNPDRSTAFHGTYSDRARSSFASRETIPLTPQKKQSPIRVESPPVPGSTRMHGIEPLFWVVHMHLCSSAGWRRQARSIPGSRWDDIQAA